MRISRIVDLMLLLVIASPIVFPQSLSEKKKSMIEDLSAKKFMRECASCHTIGAGKLKGPDLIQAITWKEEDLGKAIKKMEKEVGPLSQEVIHSLILLLKDPTLKQRLSDEEQRILQSRRATLAPADPRIGAGLFSGMIRFANNGMSCISCHAVNGVGGTLGVNLNGVYTKMGEVALTSAIEKASFKIMAPHYRNHPITPQEAVHIAAYLKQTETRQEYSSALSPYPLSAFGAIVGLVLITLFYRGVSHYSRRRS